MFKLKQKICPKDYLMSRPSEPLLPTRLDPNSSAARHEGVDPKPVPIKGQGDPDERNPSPRDITRSA